MAGTTVVVLTGARGSIFEELRLGLAPVEDSTGIDVTLRSSDDLYGDAEAGVPPDIALLPDPDITIALARTGRLVPLPRRVVDELDANLAPSWNEMAEHGGSIYGVSFEANVKSLVWYSPSRFERNGYQIPQTWDELMALQDQMKADGNVPWGIGIESGESSGWPFTDWIEEVMLRLHGPEAYDQWVHHEDLAFNDPRVKEAVEVVAEIWFTDGNVLGGRDAIAETDWTEAGRCVVTGECMMHKQGDFYVGWLGDDVTVGPDQDVAVFYLPTMGDDFGRVMIGGGGHAVAFADRPEVMEVMRYLASVEYADRQIAMSDQWFVSPNQNQDTDLYKDTFARSLAELALATDVVRMDGSDQMSDEVWQEWHRAGTEFVRGAITIDEFLNRVEQAW